MVVSRDVGHARFSTMGCCSNVVFEPFPRISSGSLPFIAHKRRASKVLLFPRSSYGSTPRAIHSRGNKFVGATRIAVSILAMLFHGVRSFTNFDHIFYVSPLEVNWWLPIFGESPTFRATLVSTSKRYYY